MVKGDVFSPHRLQRLLVFLLTRNKDRPAQLVFFLHPPLSADCIAGTGLCGSAAPPNRRLTHYPACPVEGWATVGDEEREAGVGDGRRPSIVEEKARSMTELRIYSKVKTLRHSDMFTNSDSSSPCRVCTERRRRWGGDLGGLFNYACLCLCLKDTNY